MIAKALASLAASAALLPALSRADDWPQFRGAHQGLTLETGLPLRWSTTSNVRWRTNLPGPGHSSPIVWGSRIFLTAFKPEGSRLFGGMKGRLLVLCLEKTTGRVLREREVPAEGIEEVHSTNAPASPTPVTDGTHVYAYFGSYGLVAFDLEGRKLWERPLGPYPNEWGSASSPILYGNLLLLNCDTDGEDFLLALDKATGRTVWRAWRDSTRSWPVPMIWRANGADEVVVSGSGRVKAYEAKTGRERWTVEGLTRWVVPTPVSAHGLLFVASNGPGGNLIMAIRPGGQGDVTATHVAWRYELGPVHVLARGGRRSPLRRQGRGRHDLPRGPDGPPRVAGEAAGPGPLLREPGGGGGADLRPERGRRDEPKQCEPVGDRGGARRAESGGRQCR